MATKGELTLLNPARFKRRRDVREFFESDLYRSLRNAVGSVLSTEGPVQERLARDARDPAYFACEDIHTLTAALFDKSFQGFKWSGVYDHEERLKQLEKFFACIAAHGWTEEECAVLPLAALIDEERKAISAAAGQEAA